MQKKISDFPRKGKKGRNLTVDNEEVVVGRTRGEKRHGLSSKRIMKEEIVQAHTKAGDYMEWY